MPKRMASTGPVARHPEPWSEAGTVADEARVQLQYLDRLGDPERVIRVIDAVWGDQQIPAEMLRALQHAGSVLLGAEAGEDLVGFVLGFVGLRGGIHLHSHMLGVVPAWRSRGVGLALKLGQRAASLELGIEEVRWTYDPLLRANAWLNLGRLGAIATGFLPHFYRDMSDRLNRGDRSDRFEVRWGLASEWVRRLLAGHDEPVLSGPALVTIRGAETAPEPHRSTAQPEPGATVRIPADYRSLRERDPDLAGRWRSVTSQAFRECFEAGLISRRITRDGTYVFEQEDA